MENFNMEQREIFDILGIKETTEEERITQAYRERLKVTHPEDNPTEFQLLRKAYEEAIYYARHPEKQEGQKNNTDVDKWICRMEEVYADIEERVNIDKWKCIFSDPVCDGLDTFMEAREKSLLFFANHIFIPHFVWRMLDKTFGIKENVRELTEKFPEDYLRYVIEHIQNDTFIDYTLFTYTTKDRETTNPDAFLEAYFACKNQLDVWELDKVEEELCKLSEYGVYHPFVEVEWIRYFLKTNELAKAGEVAEKLEKMHLEHHYVQFYIAETYEAKGEEERAVAIWQELTEKYPGYYIVKMKMADHYLKRNMYYEASELLQEISQNTEEDEELHEKLQAANEGMVMELKEKLKKGEEDNRFPGNQLKMNLAYYLWQTGRAEEALEVMAAFEPEQKEMYSYAKFMGMVLSDIHEYELALSYYQQALELLLVKQLKDEKEDEELGEAFFCLGECYHNLDKTEEASEVFLKAKETVQNDEWRHRCMEELAIFYNNKNEFENAIDICDEILREDSGYFPAYVNRQKAFFLLGKLQESIDDYYSAIGIYSGFYMPYQYALEVFLKCRLFEDAKEVLDLVEDIGISSPRIVILEARYYRLTAKEGKDYEKSTEILVNLIKQIEQWRIEKDERIEDVSTEDLATISFECALIEEGQEDYGSALEHIQMALELCPDNNNYHILCGIYYVNLEKYEDGISELEKAADDYEETAIYCYNLGRCYEGMNKREEAVGWYKKSLEYETCYEYACEKLSDYYKDLYEDTCKKEYFELAIDYINQELENAESVRYLFFRGVLYLDNMYLTEARRDFLRVEELSPGDWYIEYTLGKCEQFAGNYENAISYYRKSISCMKAQNESYIEPYHNLITCYKILQDFKTRARVCKEAVKAFPEELSFWRELGGSYQFLGKYEEALEAFSHMEKDEEYYDAVADLELKRGNLKKWIEYNEKVLELQEDKYQAYNDYGIGYMFSVKDYKSAIPMLKKALELAEDYDDKANCLIDIATCYYMLKEDEKAFESAEEAKRYYELHFQQKGCTEEEYMTYPRAKAARLANKSWMLLCLGRREEAVHIFEEMFKMQKCRYCGYKACFESKLYLARIYEREGDMDKAIALYEETLQINMGVYEATKSLELLK